MKEINLRDYYPFYNHDTMIEVSDEIALLFREYALLEEAYRIRTLRHKAYYSLEQEDGIERDALHRPPTPGEILEQKQMNELLYKGLATLPEKQRQRIYAHFFLGMSQRAIARAEGCNKSSVTESINSGLMRLQKYFAEYFA